MALLDKWFALDLGAYQARFYDYSTQNEVDLRTLIAQNEKEVVAVGQDAFPYLYKDLDTIQIKYPISHSQILSSVEPIIQKGLEDICAYDGLLRPCILASIPTDMTEKQKEKWVETFLNCNVRKVEFVTNLQLLQKEDPCFLIHCGHSYTEISVCAYGKVIMNTTISYAGMQMDEQIQKIVLLKTGCFITKADAAWLKEKVSEAFWNKKNTIWSCYGFDRRQILHRLQIESVWLWSALEGIQKQIALWAKHCFANLNTSLQEYFLIHGVSLSGGLANCYGLSQMISSQISCPVLCTKQGQYDMIEVLKGEKRA